MTIHQFSSNKECYFCAAPPKSSKEHVPPKLLFKGFEFSAITVPSCDLHNKEKQGYDQGFVTALKLGMKFLIENDLLRASLSSATMESIISANVEDLLQVGDERRYIIGTAGDLDPELPYVHSSVDLYDWIRLISAGLSWARLGRPPFGWSWDTASVRSPNLVQVDGPVDIKEATSHGIASRGINEIAEGLDWKPGWYREPNGYPEEIYRYWLTSPDYAPEKETAWVAFRHIFYKNFVFYLTIELPNLAASELLLHQ